MRRIFLVSGMFTAMLLVFIPAIALAQGESAKPVVALTESFQQNSIKLNATVPVTIWISNQSDIPVRDVRLTITKPAFLTLRDGTCQGQALSLPVGPIDLPAHTATAKPVTGCFVLDGANAIAGDYNILTSVSYQWDQGADLVSVEKTLKVDLIGMDTILGVPVGFAGFVLPGLMIITSLRWFKVPVVKDLEPADRILVGILLSILLLGPFAGLAALPGAPPWVTWLDFQQQVSIERLVAFTAAGLVIGLLLGLVYVGITQLQLSQARSREAWLHIAARDRPPKLIKKALRINPISQEKRIYIQQKSDQRRIYGYHFAVQDKSIYIFAHFQLILSRLPEETQAKVKAITSTKRESRLDTGQMLAILEALNDEQAEAFVIADPILVEGSMGKLDPLPDKNYFMKVDEALYQPAQLDKEPGVLLEVLDNEPF